MSAGSGAERLLRFQRRHRVTALFILLILTVLAGARALTLPVALYPSIDFPRISVIVSTRDLPFSQMEVRVTRPVSMALRGVTGVREVRSRTSRGSSEFFIRFSWNTPMVLALSRVNQALARVLPDLPPGTRSRAIRMISADTPVYQMALTSQSRSPSELTDLARYRLLPFLVNIPGVWKVEIVGGQGREVHVEVNPYELASTGKTMQDVLAALPDHNRIGVVGRLSEYHQILLLEVHNAISGLDSVRRLFLSGAGQAPLPLSQVATVRFGVRPADRMVRVSAFGKPAILLNVFRAHRENTLGVVERIEAQKKTLMHLLPTGVQSRVTYDQGHVIGQAILHVSVALVIGIGVAFAVILLFLRRFRPFILVATFVPMILVLALGLLAVFHQSINLLTLGGLAAGTGLVIDDFVVILEGGRRLPSLLRPFLFSSLASMVVLFPLFGLGGLAGAFFMPLALTLLLLLVLSLAVNLFVTPSFLGEESGTPPSRRMEQFLDKVFVLPRWGVGVALVLFFTASILVLHRDLATNFMPRMDEGAFLIDIHAPPGTSLEDSDRAFSRIEAYLRTLPEVVSTSRRLGAEMGFYITEPTKGDIIVRLSDNRRRTVFQVIDQVRHYVRKTEPELSVEFPQILEDMLNDLIGTQAPVVVRIHGSDRARMEEAVPAVIALLKKIPGVVDVARAERPVPPASLIHVESELAASYHLTPRQVIDDLRTGLWGLPVTTVMEGDIPRPVRVMDSPQPFQTLDFLPGGPEEAKLLFGQDADSSDTFPPFRSRVRKNARKLRFGTQKVRALEDHDCLSPRDPVPRKNPDRYHRKGRKPGHHLGKRGRIVGHLAQKGAHGGTWGFPDRNGGDPRRGRGDRRMLAVSLTGGQYSQKHEGANETRHSGVLSKEAANQPDPRIGRRKTEERKEPASPPNTAIAKERSMSKPAPAATASGSRAIAFATCVMRSGTIRSERARMNRSRESPGD